MFLQIPCEKSGIKEFPQSTNLSILKNILNLNLVKKYQIWIEYGRKEEMVSILGNEISNACTAATQSTLLTTSRHPASTIHKNPIKVS